MSCFANTWFAKRFCVVFYSPECALQIWFIVFFSFSFDDLVSLDKLFANPVFNYFFIFGKTFFRVIFFVFLFVYFLMICFANTMVCETFLCCVFYSPRMRVAILAFYFIVFFSFEDLVSECHAAAKQF